METLCLFCSWEKFGMLNWKCKKLNQIFGFIISLRKWNCIFMRSLLRSTSTTVPYCPSSNWDLCFTITICWIYVFPMITKNKSTMILATSSICGSPWVFKRKFAKIPALYRYFVMNNFFSERFSSVIRMSAFSTIKFKH